jgi:hypothetical protein
VSRPGGLLAVLAEVAVGAGVAVVPGVLASVVNLPNVSYRTLAGAPSSPKWLPSIAALNGPRPCAT